MGLACINNARRNPQVCPPSFVSTGANTDMVLLNNGALHAAFINNALSAYRFCRCFLGPAWFTSHFTTCRNAWRIVIFLVLCRITCLKVVRALFIQGLPTRPHAG